MAALSAARYNPNLASLYKRLVARGKKPIVALVAVMRKLIVICNAKLIPTRLDIDLCPISDGDGCDAFGIIH